jgi:esterase/lipase
MTEGKSKIHFVLVAGFSSDHKDAYGLKYALEKRGYSAEAVSFYGGKYIDDFTEITLSDCLSNISSIINKAAEKHDFVYAIGISMGGALLLEHAKNCNNLGGIISIGTPVKLKKKELIILAQKVYPLVYPVWKRLQKIKKLRLNPIGAANMLIEYIESDFAKNLDRIKTPVLLLHSKRDRVSDFKVLPQFFEALASERKQMKIFENGRHVIDEDPEIIVRQALEFFNLYQEKSSGAADESFEELALSTRANI